VTVLEVYDRRPYKIVDRIREVKKGVMAESLDELIERGELVRILSGSARRIFTLDSNFTQLSISIHLAMGFK
jgi:hypothetical protein